MIQSSMKNLLFIGIFFCLFTVDYKYTVVLNTIPIERLKIKKKTLSWLNLYPASVKLEREKHSK